MRSDCALISLLSSLRADWALTTLTTVGYGDITPANDLERLYTLFSLIVGALVFGYMLSSVGSMMANLSNRCAHCCLWCELLLTLSIGAVHAGLGSALAPRRSNLIDSRLDQLQEVIRHTDLPADLASRLRSYTEYYFTKQSVRSSLYVAIQPHNGCSFLSSS